MHAPPPAPHVVVEGVLHVFPEQQPVVHVAWQAEHAPLRHVPPPEHATQVDPAMPHAVAEGVVHVVPLQQPFGHDAALHTHW